MKLKIMKNPDDREYREITQDVNNCNGYCPCVSSDKYNQDTKCMCKEFREQQTEGFCHCGRFYKTYENEMENK